MSQGHPLHRVLVLGATGVVGGQVVRALLGRGVAVRGLRRWSSKLDGLAGVADAVEWSVGDLARSDELSRALAGCSGVVWAAAPRGFGGAREAPPLHEEIGALRQALELIRDARISRVVFVSSVLTVGPDGALRAPPEGAPEVVARQYWRELEARRFAGLGLPLVVVNAGLGLGAGAARDRGAGLKARLRYPVFSKAGVLSCVELRDLGEGVVCALERGEPGERYALVARQIALAQEGRAVVQVPGWARMRGVLGGGVPGPWAPCDALTRALVELPWGVEGRGGAIGWAPRFGVDLF